MDEQAFRFQRMRVTARFFAFGVLMIATFLAVQFSEWPRWLYHLRFVFWSLGIASCPVGASLDRITHTGGAGYTDAQRPDRAWFEDCASRYQWVVIFNATCAFLTGWIVSLLVEGGSGEGFLSGSLAMAMLLGMLSQKVETLLGQIRK